MLKWFRFRYPEVAVEFQALEKAHVFARPALLRQLLFSILSNAFEYSDREGKGRISVRIEKSPLGAAFVCADNGIGISTEEQKHIFKKFFRGAGARELKPRGEGLGLFVAAMVAETHGWKLDVESIPHIGTTFRVTMPKLP